MSIQRRRNSLFKSSISIRSINDSFQKFSEGIRSARKNSDEIIKSTRESNIFKRTLVRKDNLYFRRRQENIRRKAREDELEASSVQGVPKTQGSALARSTRGFLGRMLDFIGILLIGWAINNLPKIISGIQSLIRKITSVTGILGFFIDGVKNIVMSIGTVIRETLSSILKFDFLKDKKDIEEGIEKATMGLMSSQRELVQEGQAFQKADQFGIPEPPGFDIGKEEEKQQSRGEGIETDSDGQANLIEEPSIKEELNLLGQDIEKVREEKSENEVVQGEADDIDPSRKLLEDSLTESDSTPPLPNTNLGGTSGESVDVEDPRDVLKKKQNEVTGKKLKYPVTRSKSSFLGTSNSVENINKSVTSNYFNTQSNKGEIVASLEITDEMKEYVLSPVKKDIDINKKRKSKNTVMIIEKPVNIASSSVNMPNSNAPMDIREQVSEEKLLMKMQSTTSLKYT